MRSVNLDERAAFIRTNTDLTPVPLVPEIALYLAVESIPLWQKTEEELATLGLPPPFWAFAWAGGQGLARYILDHPDIVGGKSVLDIASGSGLVAIAAMKAGATQAIANDIDPFAAAAIALNAAANKASITVAPEDLIGRPVSADIVLIGDLFYERDIAARLLPWLRALEAEGRTVLIGDPGRSYFPAAEAVEVACYEVPVSRELEDSEIKRSRVWRLRGGIV